MDAYQVPYAGTRIPEKYASIAHETKPARRRLPAGDLGGSTQRAAGAPAPLQPSPAAARKVHWKSGSLEKDGGRAILARVRASVAQAA